MGHSRSDVARSLVTFRDACDRAHTSGEVGQAFLAMTSAVGFKYAGLGAPVNVITPPPDVVVFLNLPKPWLEHYAAHNYHLVSPVFTSVRSGLTRFFWSDPRFRALLSELQLRILAEAAAFGIKEAYSTAIVERGDLPAACTLVPDETGVDPAAYALGDLAGVYAYERARSLLAERPDHPRLSDRERECLTLAARGKSDWAISEILHLSERTVHHTVERAKARLGVASRIQAVVRALQFGEIPAEALLDDADQALSDIH